MRTAQRYTLIGLLVVTVLLLVFEETHLGKGYFYLANYYDQEVLREITVVREKPQKIGIAIVLESVKDEEKYEMALDTVRCYARHFGYGLHVIHARNETEISKKCPQKDFMFRRHCVLSLKMASIRDDWLLFLDGDMGVINPNRLIEEFLPKQDTTQLVFYSRIMNHEVMAGSYLTKNSRWAREFLMFWAEYERKLPDSFHGSDNGAIHNVILEKALPLLKDQTEICDDNYWKTAKDYDGLSTFVVCARQLLKANQTPEIEILEKGRFAWARDGWLTRSIWSDRDFILHGWQKRRQNKFMFAKWFSPIIYEHPFNLSICSGKNSYLNWRYKNTFMGSVVDVDREMLHTIVTQKQDYDARLKVISRNKL